MAVILITGCSTGFGKVSALAFARNGGHVYAAARNPDDCADIAGIADQERLALSILQLDVTDTEAIKSAVEQVIGNSGRIDVLINNAGVARLATLEDLPEIDIDHVMKVNFIAPALLSKAVLPAMRTQGYGRIIMISSLSALVGLPGETIYSASKAALEAMAEGLRYEVDRFNIYVSVVEPGLFNTAMPDKIARNIVCPADSPYAPLIKHLRQGIVSGAGRGDDPLRVAELLIRIAGEDKPAFHYPAGNQAMVVTDSLKSLSDVQREQFIRSVNDTAWWSAGEDKNPED